MSLSIFRQIRLSICLKFITGTALSGDIACDIVITVSMCYYLQRSRTGFKGYLFQAQARMLKFSLLIHSTNTMINMLITYAIRTCLLTTCVPLIVLMACSDSRCRVCTVSCLVTVSRFIDCWIKSSLRLKLWNCSSLCFPTP